VRRAELSHMIRAAARILDEEALWWPDGRESEISQFRTGWPPDHRVRIRAGEPGKPFNVLMSQVLSVVEPEATLAGGSVSVYSNI
jgi:hypothetical protein